jgi:DMSO/TMAO reductase YedYZ molybdopterin-dependent catalytic subunit
MPPGDRNAMTGALYLSRIEVTDHAITGYWEQYGYSYAGEVPASLLRPGKY